MRVEVCGVRGSTPATGTAAARYGGNTSCVAIGHGEDPPSLVLDAGTGLSRLSRLLLARGEAFRGTVLLSHLHWDHVYGLPFFPAGDRPSARVRLLMPAQGDARLVLDRVLAPPHFPITLDDLRGDWTVDALEAGEHLLEGFSVLALDIPHKGGRTFGYRVSDGTTSLAYLSDHSPTTLGEGPDGHGERHEAALRLAEGVDLLIHDAQYTAVEFPERRHFGHCTTDYAVGLAEAAGVARLLLFHHDPSRTDDDLDAIVAHHRVRLPGVAAASEGLTLRLTSGDRLERLRYAP